MMEQHLGVWLWEGPRAGVRTPAALIAFNALGGLAAPLFVTLAGAGTALAAAKGGRVDGVLVRRGLVLLGFGYLLSALTPSWFSLRSWFVLHMMGLAIATSPLWRRLPSKGLLGLAAAVIAATPLVQVWLGTPLRLSNEQMALRPPYEAAAGGHLRVAVAEGQFPILPWLALFLVGMVAGRLVARGELGGLRRLAGGVLAVGVGLAATGALGRALGVTALGGSLGRRFFDLPLGFFPATAAMITLLMAGSLWLVTLAAAIEGRAALDRRGWLVCLGRASLTLLLVHVVLFREVSRPLGLWQALPAETALGVIGLWLVVAAAAARAWERRGFRYGAEWLLRKAAG